MWRRLTCSIPVARALLAAPSGLTAAALHGINIPSPVVDGRRRRQSAEKEEDGSDGGQDEQEYDEVEEQHGQRQ